LFWYKNNPDVKFAQIGVWNEPISRQHVKRPFCDKLRAVSLREFFLENLAGDLEYHPPRGMLYLGLAGAALCFWIFSPPETKFSVTPLVFGLGSLTLLLKGIFLLRKSSEGLGLTQSELDDLSDASNRKSLPNQAAQIVQDFGVHRLLLWPLDRCRSLLLGLAYPVPYFGSGRAFLGAEGRYTTMRLRL